MVTIYHNPRCSKSRAGLQYLSNKNIEYQVIEYLKNPLTAQNIRDIAEKTKLSPYELVRTQENYYKTALKGKTFTDQEWCEIIAKNPELLKRPIVTKANLGIFAQPPQNMDALL